MNEEMKNLRLLSIFHYVVGGITYLFSLFPVIHVVIGWIAIVSPEKMAGKEGTPPPPFFGWLFLVLGLTFILLGFIFATSIIVSGRKLSKLKNYWFSFVVACLECLIFPFGTVLGIFTIVVLSKDSVKILYGQKGPSSHGAS
jgi:hypothetical protein